MDWERLPLAPLYADVRASFLPSFEMGLLIKDFLEELSPNGQVIPFYIYTTFDQKDTRSYNCHRTNWYQESPLICLLFLGKSAGDEVKDITMGSWRHRWQ